MRNLKLHCVSSSHGPLGDQGRSWISPGFSFSICKVKITATQPLPLWSCQCCMSFYMKSIQSRIGPANEEVMGGDRGVFCSLQNGIFSFYFPTIFPYYKKETFHFILLIFTFPFSLFLSVLVHYFLFLRRTIEDAKNFSDISW